MNIRPYQSDCLASIAENFEQHNATLVALFTGGGKTVIFAELLRRRAHLGRAMVLAHREELIYQAAEKIAWVAGLPVDVEMADRTASSLIKSPVVVSSVQTQISGRGDNRRMHKFDPMEFATIVCDEAHHACADSYRAIFRHYMQNPACKLLGVTATPNRADQIALGSVFDSCAFRMGIADGISEGWLVPLRVKHVKVAGLDLSGIGTVAGDFNQGQLGDAMERDEVVKATALATLEHSENRKTLVFCASVDQARLISAYLNGRKDCSSRFVCGETPSLERKEIVDGFKKSRYQYLVNYSILLEGFDAWDVSCIVCARPTKNALLLEQMIGRGTRPDAEIIDGIADARDRRGLIQAGRKPDTVIVDFVGNIGRHNIARLIDVLGGKMPDAVRELAESKMNNGCESVEDAIEQARDELAAIKVRGKAKYAGIEVFDLFGIGRESGSSPVEDGQKEKLDKWKMPIPDSAEEAQQMIEEFLSRMRRGLCTYRQAKTLKRYGYSPDSTFEEARAIIDALAANNWRPIR